jgi:hypothetical protein
MDQRDQELLDRQLKVVSPRPRNGILVLGLVFLAGIAIGGILFPHESKYMQIASQDAVLRSPNGVSPIIMR